MEKVRRGSRESDGGLRMNVTDHLFDLANGIIKRNPEVRDDGKGYEMADDGGVELEVGEFMYGLVRILKPKRVLSTGIYTGVSDMYIAQGLKDNGYGKTTALEFEPIHLKRARELWKLTQVEDQIESLLTPSLDFQPTGEYELMFLDTEPDIRFKELVKFYPHLSPGGFVFLHDLHHHLGQETIPGQAPCWPWGELPEEIKKWIKDTDLKPWYFPNPRGLTGFQKYKNGDYELYRRS